MNCYNCGKLLTEQERHREHIPADNLFAGFPMEHKTNRITVDACYKCNQSYSKSDEEFRNLIGAINKHERASGITQKMLRSYQRTPSKFKFQYNRITNQPIAIAINNGLIHNYHIKNFKGLFYHNYKTPISNDFTIKVSFQKEKIDEKQSMISSYLKSNFSFKTSGHEDVFRYIIQPFRTGYKFDGNDITPNASDKMFLAILSYTKNHAALVLASQNA